MAPRLKYAAGVTIACAIAAALITAWDPSSTYGDAEFMKRARYNEEVWGKHSATHRLHREYALADSLVPRLPPAANELRVEVSRHAYLSLEQTERLVASQLRDVPAFRARLGVFVHDAGAGTYPGHVVSFNETPLYFTGSDSVGPYCIVAQPLSQRLGGQERVGPSRGPQVELGPCLFWTKYGAPGALVERWLRQGGYHFAAAPARRLLGMDTPPSEVLGVRSYDALNPDGIACRAGDANRCIAAVRFRHEADDPAHAAFDGRHVYGHFGTLGPNEAAMLAHVEAEFGPEKFARFWTSGAEMEPAFAAAFGVPAGTWIMGWARKNYGATTRSPRVPAGSVVLTLAFVAVLAGAGVLITKYREVA